jgi:GlcNAc-P-P-Und epimerase
MKIQTIGGSGFIGTNLLDKLTDHHFMNIDKVDSVQHKEHTIIADVRDIESLRKSISFSDWLVLLAAEHSDDVSPSSLYYDVNVRGAENIRIILDEKGITRVIFVSSVAVYGLNKDNPDEGSPVSPFNDYGKSKYETEETLRAWYNDDPQNRTLIIIRSTVVFGPGNRGNVYNLLSQIVSGKFLMIGNGENKKSMAFIDNLTGFMEFCIRRDFKGYHLFNYADRPDLTTNELVEHVKRSIGSTRTNLRIPYLLGYTASLVFDIMAKILNSKLQISSVRVKKFCATTQFNSSKVFATGYKPEFSLKEGIDLTIKSILEKKDLK